MGWGLQVRTVGLQTPIVRLLVSETDACAYPILIWSSPHNLRMHPLLTTLQLLPLKLGGELTDAMLVVRDDDQVRDELDFIVKPS